MSAPQAHAGSGVERAVVRLVVVLFVLATLASPALARAQAAPPPARTIPELVLHLDDDPDELHVDFTPAVWALCEHGLDGAAAVLPLLEAPDTMTRMHASRALSCAVSRWFGWQPGHGYAPGSGAETRFEAAWTANGAYAWDADAGARHASRVLWEAWIAAHLHAAAPRPDEPSTDAVRAALEPVLPTVRACPHDPGPVRADLTFAPSGALVRVRLHGVRGAAARCMQQALASVHVAPFTRPSFTLAVSIDR